MSSAPLAVVFILDFFAFYAWPLSLLQDLRQPTAVSQKYLAVRVVVPRGPRNLYDKPPTWFLGRLSVAQTRIMDNHFCFFFCALMSGFVELCMFTVLFVFVATRRPPLK